MSGATLTAPGSEVPSTEGPIKVRIEGGLVRLRCERYDRELVDEIRSLPQRRFIRERREWVLPARRDNLAALAGLFERLGDRVQIDARDRRRVDRARRGRIDEHDGHFEVRITPRRKLLAAVRALPDRRYLPDRRCWQVPPTRAGALALLALIESGEFEASSEAVAGRLTALAQPRPRRALSWDGEPAEETATRVSPVAHWRHVTRGPIFRANPGRRQWIAGVGWCVRIRVDPGRHHREER